MCSIALPQAICDACTTMENCATAEEQIVTCISYARISSAPIRTQNMDTVYNVVSGWSIGSRAAPRCPHSRTAIVRAIKEGNRKKTREKQFHCWLNCAEKKKKKKTFTVSTHLWDLAPQHEPPNRFLILHSICILLMRRKKFCV